MDNEEVTADDLHGAVKHWRARALLDRVARGAAPFDLLWGKEHRVQVADQAGELRVEDDVAQRAAVGGGDELDAAVGDRAGCARVGGEAQFVDDDRLRAMVDDGLEDDGGLPVPGIGAGAGLAGTVCAAGGAVTTYTISAVRCAGPTIRSQIEVASWSGSIPIEAAVPRRRESAWQAPRL